MKKDPPKELTEVQWRLDVQIATALDQDTISQILKDAGLIYQRAGIEKCDQAILAYGRKIGPRGKQELWRRQSKKPPNRLLN